MDAPWRPEVGTHKLTLIAATLCITTLELVLPIVVLQVYDRVLPNVSRETLRVLLFAAAALLTVDVALRFCRAELIGANGAAFAHRASRHAVDTVLGGTAPAGTPLSPANGTAILGAVRAMKEGHSGQSLVTLVELVLAPVAIALIAAIAGPLALVPLALLALFAGFALLNGRHFVAALAERDRLDGHRFDFVIQTLRAVHSVKSLAMESWFLRRYEALKRTSCEGNYDVARTLTRGFDVAAGFSTLLTLSVVLGGALMVLDGRITVGAMIASVILSGRIGQPVQKALALQVRRQDIGNASARARALLDAQPPETRATDALPKSAGAVTVRGLSCGGADAPDAVRDMDLKLNPGEVCLVDVTTGASPTALFRAIAGLAVPEAGEIRVDGCAPHVIPEGTRAGRIAYLQRDGAIYRGTLMDNLSCFGRAPLSDVSFVARLLQLEADIAALPRGLDTPLEGTGSDSIAPGLKQRVALARQLAARPKLILFDHADTGLDRRSYTAVYELFVRLRGRATIIMATRDRNMRDLATHHLSIADGRVEELPLHRPQELVLSRYRELRI